MRRAGRCRRRRRRRGSRGARSRRSSGRSTCGSTSRWPRCSRRCRGLDAGGVPARHRGHLPRHVHGTLAALRRLRPRDRGVIVQVGSALAYRGIPLQSAYCGAKHAVKGFTDSLRAELLARRLAASRSRIVQLPALNTPQFDWVRTACTGTRSRCRRSTSPRSPRARSRGRPSTRGASCGSACPTVDTILGERVASGADGPLPRPHEHPRAGGRGADRPGQREDNLFEPPPGDPGAHGIFDDQAHGRSRSCGSRPTSGSPPPRARATALSAISSRASRATTGSRRRRARRCSRPPSTWCSRSRAGRRRRGRPRRGRARR